MKRRKEKQSTIEAYQSCASTLDDSPPRGHVSCDVPSCAPYLHSCKELLHRLTEGALEASKTKYDRK